VGLKPAVAAFERSLLADTLGSAPSIRAAARSLGISHTALLQKLRKYDLSLETKPTIGNIPDQKK
jgi:transcriptional regulator of aroF, aroG, tyrA and aromatic amino acid transport